MSLPTTAAQTTVWMPGGGNVFMNDIDQLRWLRIVLRPHDESAGYDRVRRLDMLCLIEALEDRLRCAPITGPDTLDAAIASAAAVSSG